MIDKERLAGHPLFTNRRRVLAVTQRTPPMAKTGHAILTIIAIGGGVFALFLWGLCLANPMYTAILCALPGKVWDSLMARVLGGQFGHGMADQSPWVMARIGGIVAYIGVWASVALGLAVRLHLTDALVHRATVVILHRLVSLEVLVFAAVHVAGLLLDSYLGISLADCLIPFTLNYRPLWTGIGTLGLYTCIAVVLSALYARRIGYRAWRAIHYGSFLVFIAACLHGFMSGSDSRSGWMQGLYIATGASVALLCGLRLRAYVRPGSF